MTFYEFSAPARSASLSLQDRRPFGAVFRRSADWTREIPGLVCGLAKLAAPFKRHLAVIFAFNIVLALWETIQPFILAWGVDTFAAKAPFLEIVAIIIFPMLAISLPHGIMLPLARDLYATWFFKPQFEKHVGLLCLAHHRSPEHTTNLELLTRRAPVAQEGRDSAYQLIDKLLRDPAFAFRGLVVIAVLCFKSPALLAFLGVGILADLWVTLLMDARLFTPYAAQQSHQFLVRGLEYELLDNKSLSARSSRPRGLRARVGRVCQRDTLRRDAAAPLSAPRPRGHLADRANRLYDDGRLVGACRAGLDRRIHPVHPARRTRQRPALRLLRAAAADHDDA